MSQQHPEKLIVSLTSYPARIKSVHKVIGSLLAQDTMPDKIILYLVKSEFSNTPLPHALTSLTKNFVFEIRWTDKKIKSFNKLINALTDFPNAIIITVDDDIIYPRDMVRALLKTHKKYPRDICAHRIRLINIPDGIIQPYKEWRLSERRGLFHKKITRGYGNFLTGGAGALYPPKSLPPQTLMVDKFTKLCPHQDDIWFWAMAVKNNRKISVTRFGYDFYKRTIQDLQSSGLWESINQNAQSPNNIALDNVLREYPQIAEKLGIKVKSIEANPKSKVLS